MEQLERWRWRVAKRLTGRATISRPPDPETATRSATGQRGSAGLSVVATGVPCQISRLGTSTDERAYAEQATTKARLKAVLQFDADLRVQDTITLSGKRYHVVALLGPVTDPLVVQAVVEA
jgi:hypothetical protein